MALYDKVHVHIKTKSRIHRLLSPLPDNFVWPKRLSVWFLQTTFTLHEDVVCECNNLCKEFSHDQSESVNTTNNVPISVELERISYDFVIVSGPE